MKRRILTFFAISSLFFVSALGGAAPGPQRNCLDIHVDLNPANTLKLIDGLAVSAAPSFSVNLNNAYGYDLAVVWVELTDANSSILTFQAVCTVSRDGNTTDSVPQKSTIDLLTGIATQTDVNTWQKASPGTKNWPIRLDLEGFPDFECTFSAVAGVAEAGDLLDVYARVCTEG